MDTFAFRRPEMLKNLQVFEVDHPATQDFKRRRLKELGWEKPIQLHFVPLDFTRQDLAAALKSAGYDPKVGANIPDSSWTASRGICISTSMTATTDCRT